MKAEEEYESSEELHPRLIENTKNILSAYLMKKEEFIKEMLSEEKEEQIKLAAFEEIRQQNLQSSQTLKSLDLD